MFYIFDANGLPFGNPKGYAKYSSAQGICTRYRRKLWEIYDNRKHKESNEVWSIRLLP